jgi:V8-like Glu-specific endopeptidase
VTGLAERRGLEQELGVLREGETSCVDPAGSKRQSVADVSATPYRWICLIETKTDQESALKRSTGLLIGTRRVLTAAHAVYRKGASFEKVVVKPGARDAGPGLEIAARSRHVLSEYRRSNSSANDLGVIELVRDVPSRAKTALNLRYFGDPGPRRLAYAMGLYPPGHILGLPNLTDAQLRATPVTSIGYPGDQRRSFDAMFEVQGTIRAINRTRGIADMVMDACTGQSGGPVFLFHDNDHYLIGVIASIHLPTSLAQVALLTPPRAAALRGIAQPLFTGALPARDDG